MKKITIKDPAIKEKGGKVDPAPSKAYSHDQVEALNKKKKKDVKEGFITSQGDFVSRKKAAKIAKKAGQISKSSGIKKLHSTDLRKAAGVKKKVIK